MSVRSKPLAALASMPVAQQVVAYTCPPDRTAIIKEWRFFNSAGQARVTSVWVRRAGVAVRIQALDTLPHRGVHRESSAYIVLAPGDTFEVSLGNETASEAAQLVVFGVELDGVAP